MIPESFDDLSYNPEMTADHQPLSDAQASLIDRLLRTSTLDHEYAAGIERNIRSYNVDEASVLIDMLQANQQGLTETGRYGMGELTRFISEVSGVALSQPQAEKSPVLTKTRAAEIAKSLADMDDLMEVYAKLQFCAEVGIALRDKAGADIIDMLKNGVEGKTEYGTFAVVRKSVLNYPDDAVLSDLEKQIVVLKASMSELEGKVKARKSELKDMATEQVTETFSYTMKK